MTALISAETRRLLSRRMTRFFPLSLAALMVIGVIIAYFVAGSDGPDFVNDLAQGVHGGGPGDDSTQVLGPMGFLVPIMGFVIGASYFGADQKCGMIEQLLTWEPRRTRLLLGRLVGGTATVFVLTALLSAFLVVMIYILSSLTGTVDGAFDLWASILGAVVRSGVVGALFFALGLGATVITNSSMASIVGFLIYAFILEGLLSLIGSIRPWLPMVNADAFVARNGVGAGGFFDGSRSRGQPPEFHHNWVVAGLIVLGWAGVVYLASLMAFNRRDID